MCTQSVRVASRTGRAAQSDDIEVPFVGNNNICGLNATLLLTGIGHTGFPSRVCSVVYVSSVHLPSL